MKKIFLLLSTAAFVLCGKDAVPGFENWRVLYAGKAFFRAGVLQGTPANAGAALVKKITNKDLPENVTRLRIKGEGFEAGDLSLSLRGKKRVTVNKAQKDKDGSFLFTFPALP